MTHTCTNKHIVAQVFARNQSLHRLIAHLTIDVANDPAPVLLVIRVVVQVEGTCTLRNSHTVKLIEAVEEEANHHVTPAIIELRLLSSWKHPLVLVLRDQFQEARRLLNDALMTCCVDSYELFIRLGRELRHLARTRGVLALVGRFNQVIRQEGHILVIEIHLLEVLLILHHRRVPSHLEVVLFLLLLQLATPIALVKVLWTDTLGTFRSRVSVLSFEMAILLDK